jgi:hypothetical protein
MHRFATHTGFPEKKTCHLLTPFNAQGRLSVFKQKEKTS